MHRLADYLLIAMYCDAHLSVCVRQVSDTIDYSPWPLTMILATILLIRIRGSNVIIARRQAPLARFAFRKQER